MPGGEDRRKKRGNTKNALSEKKPAGGEKHVRLATAVCQNLKEQNLGRKRESEASIFCTTPLGDTRRGRSCAKLGEKPNRWGKLQSGGRKSHRKDAL